MANLDLQREARLLLRAARTGALATNDAGQPFATLVTPGTAIDGSILMLLSDLSEHTRHLRVDARCSVLVVGDAVDGNPQTAPRVTVYGRAEIDRQPEARARWLAQHPYAAIYAGFGDFNLWRLKAEGGLIVAGFGRARRLDGSALSSPDLAFSTENLAEVGQRHATLIRDAVAAKGLDVSGWALVAADADGIDVGRGEAELTVRVAFPAQVSRWADVDSAIEQLATLHSAGPH